MEEFQISDILQKVNFQSYVNNMLTYILDFFYRHGLSRHLFSELHKPEPLETENKFILDVNPMAVYSANKLPPSFSNTTTIQRSSRKYNIVIQG